MAVTDNSYEEMVKRFCAAAEVQDPKGELNVLSHAQAELSDLKTAVAEYVSAHSGSFCVECMWLHITTTKASAGQLLPGWRLPGESKDIGQDRLNTLKSLLQDRAIDEVGKENVSFRCGSALHTPSNPDSEAATEALKDKEVKSHIKKVAFVLPHRARQVSNSAKAFTGAPASPWAVISPVAMPAAIHSQPAPPSSSPIKKTLASADNSTAADALMQELSADSASKGIVSNLKDMLKLQVLEAIDNNMATTEARLDALVQKKVAMRVKEEKLDWYKENCKTLSKFHADREKQLTVEKVQWEKDARERIKTELADDHTQWEQDLRKRVKAELADETAQWEKDLRAAIKTEEKVQWEQKLAAEKVQWEKDFRQGIKAELQQSLSRML